MNNKTNNKITLDNGYTMESTFVMDFSIADIFGLSAVKDTYKRAFNEWKDNYIYLTELVITLNLKIWQHYKKNDQLARLYDQLWREADTYAYENLKDDELRFFYNVTD